MLESLQVGMPRWRGSAAAAEPLGRRWRTGFFKEPVAGPVRLSSTGLDGDGQADRKHHGGPEMAVLGYAAGHYAAWREELGLPELGGGGFGENFTIRGATEETLSIGDTFAVGEAVVQLSSPRVPCRNISRRWLRPDLLGRVRETGRTGWYFRVLRAGAVQAGLRLVPVARPFPEWTVARANRLMHGPVRDPAEAAELAGCELLSATWRAALSRRADPGGRT